MEVLPSPRRHQCPGGQSKQTTASRPLVDFKDFFNFKPLKYNDGSLKTSTRGLVHLSYASLIVPVKTVFLASICPILSSLFFLGTFGCFFTSAMYHRASWREEKYIRKLDKAIIFLKMCTNYTICALLFHLDSTVFMNVWLVTIACMLATAFFNDKAPAFPLLYAVQGVFIAHGCPDIYHAPKTPMQQLLLVALYTIAILSFTTYTIKYPRSLCQHFNYHDVFHCITVAGACCVFGMACLAGSEYWQRHAHLQ
eukprot:Colp12_sorted_trinity150504_noHs@6671